MTVIPPEDLEPPLVDVLVPVYNAASTVEEALGSILGQSLTRFRLIVVDDGSTDGTPGLLARMASAEPRMTIVTRPNGGIVDALNAGLAICRAPYVARHDADDLAFPDRLRLQFDYLERNPDCVAVGGNAFHIDGSGARTGHVTGFREDVVCDPFYVPSMEPYLLHPFLMVRRDAIVAAGGYRYVFHSEDTDLYWRLSHAGRLANLTDVLGEYRVHAGSISSASVLNGRIASIHAQLASVSEQRRRAGRADLVFRRESLADYRAADDLASILRLATARLDVAERRYVEVASAAKMVEVSGYRPYALTPADRTTIRTLLTRHYHDVARRNRLYVVLKMILAPERLRRQRLAPLAFVPWLRLPAVLLDALVVVPSRARRLLGRAAGRGTPRA